MRMGEKVMIDRVSHLPCRELKMGGVLILYEDFKDGH